MSTLAEIEAAADALPLDEKKKLLEFLASRTPTRMAAARARRVGMTELLDTNVALYLSVAVWSRRFRRGPTYQRVQ